MGLWLKTALFILQIVIPILVIVEILNPRILVPIFLDLWMAIVVLPCITLNLFTRVIYDRVLYEKNNFEIPSFLCLNEESQEREIQNKIIYTII